MGSISPKCVFAAKSSLLPLHHLGFLEGDSDYNPLSYTMREKGATMRIGGCSPELV